MSNLFTITSDVAWGPPKSQTVSVLSLEDVPYAPFSKGDRIGRVADWTEDQSKQDNRGMNAQQSQTQGGGRRFNNMNRGDQASATSLFSYQHGDEDASFSLVDASGKTTAGLAHGAPVRRPLGGRRVPGSQAGGRPGGQRGGPGGAGGDRGGAGGDRSGGAGGRPQGRYGGGPAQRGGRFGGQGGNAGYGGRGYQNAPRVTRDSSIAIGVDWTTVFELELNKLTKISAEVPDVPETMAEYGTLFYLDKSYDRVNTKSSRPLVATSRSKFVNVSTSADPIIQQIARDNPDITIFATDSIMAMLMTCTRSVYSWDVLVTRTGNCLYLDRRPGQIDMLTVNENAQEPPPEVPGDKDKDGINTASNLALEATYINANFSQQIVDFTGERHDMSGGPNPFVTADNGGNGEDAVPSAAYRYRKWHLGNGVQMVARTEVDGITRNQTTGADQLVNIKCLNEFDPRAAGASSLDWKQKLDSQRGAVVATEMKNNGYKVARWAVQSLLSGADVLKIGYVSRANPKNVDKHVILGVSQNYRPHDFGSQMNLSLTNVWAILKVLIDECFRQPDGNYIFVKDPNKPVIRLYAVPHGTFEGDHFAAAHSDNDEADA
ncbi:hypothetical protein RI367_005354 [Sorochytrium milnesiophthora]